MAQLPRVGDVLSRYRIDDQIGFGGMGVVYGATDLDLARRVAVKVLSAELGGSGEFLQRFEREAALLARVASPHVIGVYDYGEHDGNPYIVTQYVGGGDLGDLIRRRGPMPAHLALDVCAQVADALSDTHRLGIIHRDVKPTNVLLRDPDESRLQAYLCDFGIARTSTDGLTVAGGVSGTWAYLAPEVAMGEPATPRSDIYALGCLLWAALTGRPPYTGSDVEMAYAHQRSPVRGLAGSDPLSRKVDEILRRTMAKDPEERYADAAALRTDLLGATALPPAPMTPVDASDAGSTPGVDRVTGRSAPVGRRRTSLLVGGVAAALVVGVAATLAVVRPWSGSGSPASEAPPSRSPSASPSPVAHRKLPIQGDLDGDGHGDLLVSEVTVKTLGNGDRWVTNIRQLHSEGRRATGGHPTVTTLPKGDWDDYVTADFDGDEKLDLVRVRYPAKGHRLHLTGRLSGGGRLDASVTVPGGHKVDGVVGAADVDGDGRADLVMYNCKSVDGIAMATGDAVISVALSTVTGLAASKTVGRVTLKGGEWWTELTVGDVTGDGHADLAVLQELSGADSPDEQMHSLLNVYSVDDGHLGTPLTLNYLVPDGVSPDALLAGDVDGDGKIELVAIDDEDGAGLQAARVIDYDGILEQPETWAHFDYGGGDAFGLSDVDGDGAADLLGLFTTGENHFVDRVRVMRSAHRQFSQSRQWAHWPEPPTQGVRHEYFLMPEVAGD